MSEHPDETPDLIRVDTITFSDSRTAANDEGGRLLGELLTAAGFLIASHEILREDADAMKKAVELRASLRHVEAIITTGGTGVAPRDRTIEAVSPLFDKTLEGFGEAFRRLSWDSVGPRAILSRATAGVVDGRIVILLPGSPGAVRVAVEQLIKPTLAHMVALASGKGGKHAGHGHAKRESNP